MIDLKIRKTYLNVFDLKNILIEKIEKIGKGKQFVCSFSYYVLFSVVVY